MRPDTKTNVTKLSLLVTGLVVGATFFTLVTKPVLAGCGFLDITCDPREWENPLPKLTPTNSESDVDPVPSNPSSVIRFCNGDRDGLTLFAMYATYDKTNRWWYSRGWFKIPNGQCKRVDIGRSTGNAFVYAEDEKGDQYTGERDGTFCVNDTNSFDIPYSDRKADCTGEYKWVKATSLVIRPGLNTYIFGEKARVSSW